MLYIDNFGRKPVMMFGAVEWEFVILPSLLSLTRMNISGTLIGSQAGLLLQWRKFLLGKPNPMPGGPLTVDSWLYILHFGYSEQKIYSRYILLTCWREAYRLGTMCLGPLSEIWPLSSRAYGIVLGVLSNWMCNFIVTQITPVVLQKFR